MTDCVFDEDDTKEPADDWKAADFKLMENNREFWEARLAKTNPEYLLEWQAWRGYNRMDAERKLRAAAMPAPKAPAESPSPVQSMAKE